MSQKNRIRLKAVLASMPMPLFSLSLLILLPGTIVGEPFFFFTYEESLSSTYGKCFGLIIILLITLWLFWIIYLDNVPFYSAKALLSTKDLKKVEPINHLNANIALVLTLSPEITFYAMIVHSHVEIYVKEPDKDNKIFFEKRSCSQFLSYYRVVDETE